MKIHIRKKYPLIAATFAISFILLLKATGVMLNITPSMPEGIYIKKSGAIKRGDIVAACLENPYQEIGLKNLYLEKGHKCNGADPVIKSVIAVPGDEVVLKNNSIQVNSTTFPLKTFPKDSRGRNLSAYPKGRYTKTEGYWLIGTHAINSWDSRYWGPIKRQQILYRLKQLI